MTIEEAITIFKRMENYFHGELFTDADIDMKSALSMAIKALEQESILDKIRAEIDCQEKWLMSAGCNAYNVDIAFNSIRSVVKESEE